MISTRSCLRIPQETGSSRCTGTGSFVTHITDVHVSSSRKAPHDSLPLVLCAVLYLQLSKLPRMPDCAPVTAPLPKRPYAQLRMDSSPSSFVIHSRLVLIGPKSSGYMKIREIEDTHMFGSSATGQHEDCLGMDDLAVAIFAFIQPYQIDKRHVDHGPGSSP